MRPPQPPNERRHGMAFIGDDAVEMEPIETDNIGSLAQLAVSQLPGCDDLVLRQQLGFALREFCRETDACVVTQHAPFCEHRTIPLTMVPSGMEMVSVLDVTSCGRRVGFSVVDAPVPSVRLEGWAAAGDWIAIRFSVAPKAGGEDCPRWFKERYAETIVEGALFKMMSMRGKPWEDQQQAAMHGAKWQNAIAEAAYRRMEGSAINGGPMSAIPSGGLFM